MKCSAVAVGIRNNRRASASIVVCFALLSTLLLSKPFVITAVPGTLNIGAPAGLPATVANLTSYQVTACSNLNNRLEVVSKFQTLTPALSHPMGEGARSYAAGEPERFDFNRRVLISPSPIGWERAGVRVPPESFLRGFGHQIRMTVEGHYL